MPDVFRSPFQVAPLDLGGDAFYHARREQLDKQLSRIADGEAGEQHPSAVPDAVVQVQLTRSTLVHSAPLVTVLRMLATRCASMPRGRLVKSDM